MALVCNLGAAAAAAVADYEMVAGLPEVSGRGDPSGWLKVRYAQSPEFKFRFVFFRLQMLRFSALCGPHEQKFGEL